jgi:hypothetical protein
MFYNVPLNLGSRASLRLPPTKLKAKTTNIMAIPGVKYDVGFDAKYLWPSLIIFHQVVVGG